MFRVRNNVKVEIKYLRVVSLRLKSGFEHVLENTFYVLLFRRNLIYVSTFDFKFEKFVVELLLNSKVISECLMDNGMYNVYWGPINTYASMNVKNNVGKKTFNKWKIFFVMMYEIRSYL